MSATLEKLLSYAAGGMDKKFIGSISPRAAKTTDKTDKTPLQNRILAKTDSFVSYVSAFSGACSKKHIEPETILERAAIMEYDGDLPRDEAERFAAANADSQRPQGTEAEAVAWREYVKVWFPDSPDALPDPPPTSSGWHLWWQAINERGTPTCEN